MKLLQVLILAAYTGFSFSFLNTRHPLSIYDTWKLQKQKTVFSSSLCMTHDHLDSSLSKKIFCNVELNGQSVEAVGFDMDFTLAQVCYKS